MKFPRASGILLHITSLPGPFGIGDLGSAAYRFADFLKSSEQSLWQILPLGPTGYGNSPYQCPSVFAGNPLFINLEKLAQENLLDSDELENPSSFSEKKVNYSKVVKFKMPLLKKSFKNFEKKTSPRHRRQFEAFCNNNSYWLEEYALYMALKEKHELGAWNTWEEDIKMRAPEALKRWRSKLARNMEFHKFQQYQFFRQCRELKEYCNSCGIKLIGDIPIFAAYDSAEVWSHPEMFYLDAQGKPTVLAGVPPDYFSKTGQLWGNPLYRWELMEKDGYAWWVERLRTTLSLVDIVRLDHFRGFEKYWEVPAQDTTAEKGKWVPGPGAAFFEAIQRALGELPIIAEDLGYITPEVHALRDHFEFPGMRVLQFAFGNDLKDDLNKPHNFPRNCVVYTGTHDNNTTIGWFRDSEVTTMSKAAREKERHRVLKYLGTDGHEINWDFVRLALMSVADMAIIPLQDILGLGSEARMNLPGKATGNWSWRFTFDMLTDGIKDKLKEMTIIYGRNP